MFYNLTTVRQTLLAFGLTIIGLVIVILCLKVDLDRRADLGNKSAAFVFRTVLRCGVPTGISNLKIAGTSSMAGEVWIRFRSQNVHAVLTALRNTNGLTTTGPAPSPDDIAMPSVATWSNANDRYKDAVGWQAIKSVKKPEYYGYEWSPQGQGWFGIIAVDRQHGDFYIYGIEM